VFPWRRSRTWRLRRQASGVRPAGFSAGRDRISGRAIHRFLKEQKWILSRLFSLSVWRCSTSAENFSTIFEKARSHPAAAVAAPVMFKASARIRKMPIVHLFT